MKSYWQADITLPLFQMAQRFWPFHARGCVKPWPLCSASRSHCVWVRVFRRGSNCVINSQRSGKTKLNLHRLGLYHWKLLCHHIWRKASATCLNLTQNKPTFTNNTHQKSVNVYSGLLSRLFFPLSNFFPPSLVSGWNLGKKRGIMMRHLGIPLVGQGESVSLMTCSFCRCHLVIILRKPSAWLLLQGTCFSSVFWVLCDWQEPCCVLFHPDLLLHLPPVSRGPENRYKGKLWSLWNNKNW